MKNSGNLLALLFCFFIMQAARGAQGIIFDVPALVSVNAGGIITGYYDAKDEKKSCSFLFMQIGGGANRPARSDYSKIEILTFVPKKDNFSFSGRDKLFDIAGTLYRRDDTWLIRTDVAQAGCENELGEFTSFPASKVGGETFTVRKRIAAKEIRLVNRKSFFYELREGRFIASKRYLVKSNGVIVLRTRNEFSYVRFADPRVYVENPGRVTTGWVRSADLANPFPPANRQ